MPNDFAHRGASAAAQWLTICPCILLTVLVAVLPDVSYFINLLCLYTPDDLTHWDI